MSDYQVYPYYMQRKKTVGDVTFARKTLTGSIAIAQTKLDPKGKIIPKGLIVQFRPGGSGFIIKKLDSPIKIKNEHSYIVGIILTAAHVVCETTTFQFNPKRFSCYFNNQAEAIPMKCFMKNYNQPMQSATNKNFYMYPGDLALLLLLSPIKNLEINELRIETDCRIENGMPVRVAGFPSQNKSNIVAQV